jgi:hypothetical protein
MMKGFSLGLLLLSCAHADWTSDLLQKSTALYDETREKTIQIYKDTLSTKPQTHEALRAERLGEAWDNVVDELQEGTHYIDELKRVPESSWIGRDKAAVQEDINALFDRIIEGLVGDDLMAYKGQMERLREKIDRNKSRILTYREKRIGAPESSKIYTTKSDYDEKIKDLKDENAMLENEMRIIKQNLQQSFADIGVDLSMEQIDVLLTRVDGDDIIQISLVMDTLKYITRQILQLMKESNEELKQAKKYYGMHQVLLELVVYIQQKYIDKTNNLYIPKINKIITDAENMIEQTKRLKAQEEDPKRAAVYAHNIEALEWTLRVAEQYRLDLIRSRNKMTKAQVVALANLKVSQNTYETVSLNADLYDLISESQEMFVTVSRIQVPDIVPFENVQIRKKYKELTQMLH